MGFEVRHEEPRHGARPAMTTRASLRGMSRSLGSRACENSTAALEYLITAPLEMDVSERTPCPHRRPGSGAARAPSPEPAGPAASPGLVDGPRADGGLVAGVDLREDPALAR